MKVSRPLLIGLAALALVALTLVVAAFTPAVQRWALLRAARAQPGLQLELDRIHATAGRFEIGGLRLERSGVKLTAEKIDGDFRLWGLLTGSSLEIDQIVARGLMIDASAASPATASVGASAPAAVPGALGQLELPLDITIGSCDLAGRARLPNRAAQPPIEADFALTGGGLAPGREGTFRLQATLRNPAAQARVALLKTETSLRLTESRTRTFSRVIIASTVDAEGPGLNGPTQLRMEGRFENGTAGESYSARVDSLAAGLSDTLVAIEAKLAAGAPQYEGTWRLRATRAQVEPFYLGGELPEFDIAGEGQLGFAPASGDGSLQGKLDVNARRFERLDPALRAIGPVRLQSEFDLARAKGTAQLRQLVLALAAEQPVLEVRTTQAITLDLAQGHIRVGGGAPEVARVRLLGVPLAWVRPFVTAFDVSGGRVTGEIALTSDGRRLSVQTTTPLRLDELSVVQEGEALLTQASLLADLEGGLAEGRWRTHLRRLELATPAGDSLVAQISMEGSSAADSAVGLSGNYEARLPTLLQPYLAGFQIQARGELALTAAGPQLSVEKFTSEVRTLDGQPVLSTQVHSPFTYATESKAIKASAGDAELMRVELGRIELAPLLGRMVGGIAGNVAQGSFALESDGGGWRLRPIQPVLLNGLELAENGEPSLGGVSLQAAPKLVMTADGKLEVDVGELVVRTRAGAPLATVKGTIAQEKVETRANVTFQVELPSLAQLPAFAAAAPLTQGRASGEVRAVFDGKDHVEARVTLNGLVAGGSGALLPVANISLRAMRQPDGGMTVDVPVLLDRAGVRSDMNFQASLARGGKGHLLKAKLSGNQVALEDLAAVIAVFSGATADAPAAARPEIRTAEQPIQPDVAPPWSRVAGEVGLEFKSLTYGRDWTATDLRGSLQIEPARVSLPIVEAAFGERGRLEAHGEISFTTGPRPYDFTGGFAVTEFDPAPFFRALDPERPPTVEGKFNVQGKFSGEGRTIDETFGRSRGGFQLTSRQGTFRGLKRGTEKISVATRAVEIGAALGSLFGSDKVRGAAEKVAGNAYFADQLAQEFGELKYDQLTIRLERGESLDVKLAEVALISPEVRLVGQGTITHIGGRPLLDQPLTVELNLGSRGKVESLLDRANLLLGPTSRDDLGYCKAKYPIVVAGTVARPDALSFYTRLATSKLLDSLAPEN